MKNFKADPTEYFLSRAESEGEKSDPVKSTEKESIQDLIARIKILKSETKSRRVQLLIRPSTHRGLKSIADSRDQSVNDLICEILDGWLLDQERSEK